jgi:membrane protein insertase Oxa1/YidC/SpoIIIJ
MNQNLEDLFNNTLVYFMDYGWLYKIVTGGLEDFLMVLIIMLFIVLIAVTIGFFVLSIEEGKEDQKTKTTKNMAIILLFTFIFFISLKVSMDLTQYYIINKFYIGVKNQSIEQVTKIINDPKVEKINILINRYLDEKIKDLDKVKEKKDE